MMLYVDINTTEYNTVLLQYLLEFIKMHILLTVHIPISIFHSHKNYMYKCYAFIIICIISFVVNACNTYKYYYMHAYIQYTKS